MHIMIVHTKMTAVLQILILECKFGHSENVKRALDPCNGRLLFSHRLLHNGQTARWLLLGRTIRKYSCRVMLLYSISSLINGIHQSGARILKLCTPMCEFFPVQYVSFSPKCFEKYGRDDFPQVCCSVASEWFIAQLAETSLLRKDKLTRTLA